MERTYLPFTNKGFTPSQKAIIIEAPDTHRQHFRKRGDHMTEKEMMQRNIEEFSRLQSYMILATEKDSEIYKAMKVRYVELKVILTTSGINLTELDRIKE